MKTLQFDLKKALNGYPLLNKKGEEVIFLSYDSSKNYPLECLVCRKGKKDLKASYTNLGHILDDRFPDKGDLLLNGDLSESEKWCTEAKNIISKMELLFSNKINHSVTNKDGVFIGFSEKSNPRQEIMELIRLSNKLKSYEYNLK